MQEKLEKKFPTTNLETLQQKTWNTVNMHATILRYYSFSNYSCMFLDPNFLSNLSYNCSIF